MPVLDVNDTNFTEALAGAELAIVDFYASWCGPCIMFAATFAALSEQYPHVRFLKLDGEKSPQARKTVQIPGLPYFAVYRDGVFLDGVATSKEAKVRELLDRHFAAAGAPA